jgi:hypothetical protein
MLAVVRQRSITRICRISYQRYRKMICLYFSIEWIVACIWALPISVSKRQDMSRLHPVCRLGHRHADSEEERFFVQYSLDSH